MMNDECRKRDECDFLPVCGLGHLNNKVMNEAHNY